MNIEILPSGSYRVRKSHKGKMYRMTFDHKPTQREVFESINQLISQDNVDVKNMTFEAAAKEYLKIKSNVLSPSTKRGYDSLIRNIPSRLSRMNLIDITQADVQLNINDYAKDHSAKSVSNMHGFISAVIREFKPSMKLYTKLPQKKISDDYVPSSDDIARILKLAQGSAHELGLKLALCGLRRSEICALTPDDLDENNILKINKAWVQGEDKKWYCKELTKTDAGTREILLPESYAELYREAIPDKNNHIYGFFPNTLRRNLCSYQEKLGIPHFSLHKCRHYYASLLHAEGIPDSYIMEMGGWKSDYVMKSVYRHALDDQKALAMKKAALSIVEKTK